MNKFVRTGGILAAALMRALYGVSHVQPSQTNRFRVGW